MASGTGDAWARDLFTKLDALNFEVWVAFHHEPEGDGVTTDWRKMQDHLSRMVPGGTAGDIKFWLIVDRLDPGVQPDRHRQPVVDALPDRRTDLRDRLRQPLPPVRLQVGQRRRRPPRWTPAGPRARSTSTSSPPAPRRYGVKAAIGEYGYSDEAFAKDKAWLDRFIASAKAKKLLAVAYFDTQLNSTRSWWLGAADSAKRAYFNSVMSR